MAPNLPTQPRSGLNRRISGVNNVKSPSFFREQTGHGKLHPFGPHQVYNVRPETKPWMNLSSDGHGSPARRAGTTITGGANPRTRHNASPTQPRTGLNT